MIPDGFNWQSGLVWFFIASATAVISYLGCRLTLRFAIRLGMIVQPGTRQSHRQATPTGGGLGIIVTVVLATFWIHTLQTLPVFWWFNMLPGILLLALIGWLDDKKPLASTLRLLVQFIVSLWLLLFAGFLDLAQHAALVALTTIMVVWMMNLYNFMDGSNGMAGFQGVFCATVFAALFALGGEPGMALIALVVAAACCGFLPLNFPQARIFMGDVASVPLGFIFAGFAVYGVNAGVFTWWVPILVMSVFIVDASLTLAARVIQQERWYTAHKQHVYQRLIEQEWSHSQVLMVYQTINVVMVLPALVLANMYPQYAIVTTVLTLGGLGAGWYIANWKLGAHSVRRLG